MSGYGSNRKSKWGEFIAILLVAAFVALLALIPSSLLEATWRSEQRQMSLWAGESTSRWVEAQALTAMTKLAKDAEKAANNLGGSPIDRWLTDRIYASLMWANVVAYRIYTLIMWALLGMPIMIAASVDGFYVREIRKTAFISASPIRYRIGMHLLRLVSIALLLWLFLPLPTPFIAAPAIVCVIAISLWLWVSNLQKRL